MQRRWRSLRSLSTVSRHWSVYLLLLQDRSPYVVEAQLFMRQARPESFRKYTVVAENNVAIATRDVALIRSRLSSSFNLRDLQSYDDKKQVVK